MKLDAAQSHIQPLFRADKQQLRLLVCLIGKRTAPGFGAVRSDALLFLTGRQSDALDGMRGVEGVGYLWFDVAHVVCPRFCWNIRSDRLDHGPV